MSFITMPWKHCFDGTLILIQYFRSKCFSTYSTVKSTTTQLFECRTKNIRFCFFIQLLPWPEQIIWTAKQQNTRRKFQTRNGDLFHRNNPYSFPSLNLQYFYENISLWNKPRPSRTEMNCYKNHEYELSYFHGRTEYATFNTDIFKQITFI